MADWKDPESYYFPFSVTAAVVAFGLLMQQCGAVGATNFGATAIEAETCARLCGAPEVLVKKGLCGCITWKDPKLAVEWEKRP